MRVCKFSPHEPVRVCKFSPANRCVLKFPVLKHFGLSRAGAPWIMQRAPHPPHSPRCVCVCNPATPQRVATDCTPPAPRPCKARASSRRRKVDSFSLSLILSLKSNSDPPLIFSLSVHRSAADLPSPESLIRVVDPSHWSESLVRVTGPPSH